MAASLNHDDKARRNWASFGFDLVTLRVFKTAVEERSLVRAAEKEHIAVSAISRRIAYMEARVGTPLLVRRARGVEATAAGRALLGHLRSIFADLEGAVKDVALTTGTTGSNREKGGQHGASDGRVRLHANLSALLDFLPNALSRFEVDYPWIEVSVEEHTSAEILRAVANDYADVGVMWDLGQATDMELIPCRTERLVVLLPASHPLAGRDSPVDFRQVATEPFVCLSTAQPILDRCRSEAMSMGKILRERCTVNSLDCVKRLVSTGVGIAIVPEAGVVRNGQNKDLSCRPLRDPWASRVLSLCVRSRHSLSKGASLLVDRLQRPECATLAI